MHTPTEARGVEDVPFALSFVLHHSIVDGTKHGLRPFAVSAYNAYV